MSASWPHPLIVTLGERLRSWAERNPEVAESVLWWAREMTEPPPPDEAGSTLTERMYRRVMPRNWWTLTIGAQQHARRVMPETGVCVAWVPRADVVLAIIGASSKEARDAVLVEHANAILDDICAVLAEAVHPELGDLPSVATEATEAFRAGYDRASQALCAAALGTVLDDHYGHTNFAEARREFEASSPDHVDIREFRHVSIQWAIRFAILRANMESAPEGFNRHLTAHGTQANFTRAHTIAALMLLAGSLRELHEIYTIGDSTARRDVVH